ncbi:MAG: oligopeptidase B [Candidatus Aminicenantes bacterium RBG_16_63_16]|nr:MAG: oligopeptidase B [Candidatus Aminicenantes bacterium RBG_16_63_16]
MTLAAAACGPKGPVPPAAEKIPQELTAHGQTRVDNYYWLRERDNPKVIAYLKAENDHLRAVMKPTEPLQEALYREMAGRIKPADLSVPSRKGGYYYYRRYEEGKDYPIFCRKKGSLEAEEEIILDGNGLAAGHSFFSVAGLEVSPDGNILAYAVDTVSRRLYTLHFKNLKTGETLADAIPDTDGPTAWANDSATVFYTLKDTTTLRPYRVMKHILGTDPRTDAEVFVETDETFTTGVFKSKSRKFLLIASESTLTTEYRYLDADRPHGGFRVIQPRERGLEYHAEHFRDKFYIRTNDQARNFRLMAAPLGRTTKDNWTEVVPRRDDVLLEDFEVFENFLVVEELKSGLTGLRAIRWNGGAGRAVDFGEETYSVSLGDNPELETDWLRFNYSSLTTPDSVYDYGMATGEKKLLKRQEVLGGFKPEDYRAERLFVPAPDGARIPLSVVYRTGFRKDGDGPLLLYGYGSYGASETDDFSASRLSLLDRGFAFAVAHIRGGSEMGRAWYEDGKLLKKKNTFTDFIACAEFLVARKYTRSGKLFAMGGSAGGLLMGAVVNLRPDLFNGVVAQVPYVDVVTTMLDPGIPLTTDEYDEWGNPAAREYYDYMLSYSPYDNVAAKDYPALLVTTGLHDSQVQYWEPAKWVAKLRAIKTDRRPLLLYTNMDAGHGGASGRFRSLRETALEYAFLLGLAGIRE